MNETPNLLANTSIEEDVDLLASPAIMPTRPPLGPVLSRRERRQMAQARNRAVERVRQFHLAQRAQLLNHREILRRNERADALHDRLVAHQAGRQAAVDHFNALLDERFDVASIAAELEQERSDLNLHLRFASILSTDDVRVWDIISWFPWAKTTQGLQSAVKRIQRHLQLEAHLRYELDRVENGDRESDEYLQDDATWCVHLPALARRLHERPGRCVTFGYEPVFVDGSWVPNGVHAYKPHFEGRQRFLWILAAFKTRARLYLHNAEGIRYPAWEWQACLDHKLSIWCRDADNDLKRLIEPDNHELSKGTKQEAANLLYEVRDFKKGISEIHATLPSEDEDSE